MVYRPDGSGRDMYVLGPRNSNGPQIIDVAARNTRSMSKDANRALLNASLMRTDNKVPSNIPDYELRGLISRKIAERAQTATSASLSASQLGSGVSSDHSPPLSPTKYNSGVVNLNHTNAAAAVVANNRAANGYFTSCQRGSSSYVHPKSPNTPRDGSPFHPIRVGTSALTGSTPVKNILNGTGSGTLPIPTSPFQRRTPSAGFIYNRHIYESTQHRTQRTALAFQPYEAPVNRSVFPEIRARYSNM